MEAMKKIGKYLWMYLLCFLLAAGLCSAASVDDEVVVLAATKKASINKKNATVKANKTVVLKVKNVPSSVKKVTWSTNNKAVARVQSKSGSKRQNAIILGVKYGTATITAKVGSRKLKTTVKVTCVHNWSAATCTSPKTCSICGVTKGSAKGHKWSPATCTSPQTCTVCGATAGAASGHSWSPATCVSPQTCTVCGATTGGTIGHNWSAATCTSPQTCTVCGATTGSALGHMFMGATCQEQATCVRCGARGEYGSHNFNDDGYCQTSGCDEIDINYWLPMYILNYGSETREIQLFVGNYMVVSVTFGDINLNSTRAYEATFYPTGSGTSVKALLVDANGNTISRGSVAAGASGYISWLKDSADVISIDSKLEFDISFTYPSHPVSSGTTTLFTVSQRDYQYHIVAGADITTDSSGLPQGMVEFTRLN